MKKIFFLLLVVSHAAAYGQVVGGEHSFEFLRLSNSPHVTALGGVSVSSPSKDVMMGFANPALLRPEFHTTIGMNHNFYYGGTRVSNVLYTQFNQKLNTTFGLGMTYLNYGSFTQTDNLGNSNGTFRAVDYAIHVMASKHYLEKWRYGIDLKYASSNLASQRSSALLADVGVMFADTASQWYFGAVVKNAGITIKNYDPSIPQSVPVDLQIGFTKKFKKAPFSIMVLAHHLTKWDIRYDNPADRIDNQLLFENTTDVKKKSYFADKLFRHFVFALDINLGKRLEISAGYNHLRRSELSIVDKKGMSGFSFGAGMYLNKFTIHYAQSIYHVAGPYHELGLNIRLNDLFGMGNMGNKINWSEKFARSY